MTEIPPWKPIADWLCRLDDCDHGPVTKEHIRKDHEAEAKAIAYDIAASKNGRAKVNVPDQEEPADVRGDRLQP